MGLHGLEQGYKKKEINKKYDAAHVYNVKMRIKV
jgi:hypothetical protein